MPHAIEALRGVADRRIDFVRPRIGTADDDVARQIGPGGVVHVGFELDAISAPDRDDAEGCLLVENDGLGLGLVVDDGRRGVSGCGDKKTEYIDSRKLPAEW